MNADEMSKLLASAYDSLNKRWEGYEAERITEDDFKVTLAAMVDYLSGDAEVFSIEIPNTDLLLDKHGDSQYNVWVKMGVLDDSPDNWL